MGAFPTRNANNGAPVDGTPFSDGKPENPAVDTGDATPPVSAETGEELPPLPVPTETAETPTTPPAPPVTTPDDASILAPRRPPRHQLQLPRLCRGIVLLLPPWQPRAEQRHGLA